MELARLHPIYRQLCQPEWRLPRFRRHNTTASAPTRWLAAQWSRIHEDTDVETALSPRVDVLVAAEEKLRLPQLDEVAAAAR